VWLVIFGLLACLKNRFVKLIIIYFFESKLIIIVKNKYKILDLLEKIINDWCLQYIDSYISHVQYASHWPFQRNYAIFYFGDGGKIRTCIIAFYQQKKTYHCLIIPKCSWEEFYYDHKHKWIVFFLLQMNSIWVHILKKINNKKKLIIKWFSGLRKRLVIYVSPNIIYLCLWPYKNVSCSLSIYVS